jgi:hypothetical protein
MELKSDITANNVGESENSTSSGPTTLCPNNLPEEGSDDQRKRGKLPDTRDVHVRIPIHSYQYLNELAVRYGMRSLGSAICFLVESHREAASTRQRNPS